MSSITSLFKRVINTFTSLASDAADSTRGTLTTSVQISALPCNLYGWMLTSSNTSAVYVKFYDQALAPVIGTDPVKFGPLEIPAAGTSANGQFGLIGTDVIENFSTAMWIGVSTDPADAGTTPPASAIQYTVKYKK